jgi:hypothetical protein
LVLSLSAGNCAIENSFELTASITIAFGGKRFVHQQHALVD